MGLLEKTLTPQQAQLLRDLRTWSDTQGPAVAFLEGFPGVGKTVLARAFRDELTAAKQTCVWIQVAEEDSLQDLLLGLNQELQEVGITTLDAAFQRNALNLDSLAQVLQQPVVLIIDEFQKTFSGNQPGGAWLKFLGKLADRRPPGRLLLLCNQAVERASWSREHALLTLANWNAEQALGLFTRLLEHRGQRDNVPSERDRDLVTALGCNPRALEILVESLSYESLEELVSELPADWKLEDRELSADLLKKLEVQLLERVLQRLDPDQTTFLQCIAVHRKGVKQEAFKDLGNPEHWGPVRNDLINRFLVTQDRGWYEPHTLVREILIHRRDTSLNAAHAMAADYHSRHFKGAQVVKSPGELGGHFLEAAYHLLRCRRGDEIQTLSTRFDQYLQQTITHGSPVPTNPAELDHRISTLSALLKHGGRPGWSYHLARCLLKRGQPEDRLGALEHVRQACGPQAPSEPWVLRIKLEEELEGLDAALVVAQAGLKQVPPERSLFSIYQQTADMLTRGEREEDAIKLLKEGIDRVPATQNLFILYQACGEALQRMGRDDEAIELLKEGIDRIPAAQGLYILYEACGRTLQRVGRDDEAIKLLKEGIGRIPATQNLSYLYTAAAQILAESQQVAEAVRILTEGLGQVPENARFFLSAHAFLYCVASGDETGIHDLMNKTGLGPAEKGMGELCLLLCQNNWEKLTERACALNGQFPHGHFFGYEAFGHLCLGRPERAGQALARFPKGTSSPQLIWLQALIAIKENDVERARVHLTSLLDRPLAEAERLESALLLRIWDESKAYLGKTYLHYNFPVLPPSLTGLPETVVHPPYSQTVLPPWVKGLAAPGPAPTDPGQKPLLPCFLLIATEWDSGKGGLSTFNRELCKALANAGAHVSCLVPQASAEEEKDAQRWGVCLLKARATPGFEGNMRLASLEWPSERGPFLVVGHDHVTGPYALHHATHVSCKGFIQVIHTIPDEIEWFKAQSADDITQKAEKKTDITQKAEKKTERQSELARKANLVVAVGPRIFDTIRTELAGFSQSPPVLRLDPGLSPLEEERGLAPNIQVLLLGRAEDDELKGCDLAAAALGKLRNRELTLVIRGTSPGTGDALREKLVKIANNSRISILPREYTSHIEVLQAELRRASLVLMPSRAEGFGLVGLEALAAGTPVLVSGRSGLGQVFREIGGEAAKLVVPITNDLDTDAAVWEREIDFVLRNREAATENIRAVYAQVKDHLTWEKAAGILLDWAKNREAP